jgi:hypothetical protein
VHLRHDSPQPIVPGDDELPAVEVAGRALAAGLKPPTARLANDGLLHVDLKAAPMLQIMMLKSLFDLPENMKRVRWEKSKISTTRRNR